MEVYFIVGGFILFDILTGVALALFNGTFNSSVMREGGRHKLAEVFAIVGAGLLEYTLGYIDLGVELPVVNVVAVYICVMELGSCLENICKMNPKLRELLKPYMEKLK